MGGTSKKPIHVVPDGKGGWKGVREGASRSSVVAETQAAVENRSRQIARNSKTELIIHGRDGEIRARESYGNDPNPPIDREH
jgi:hypothetical protein